MSSSTVFRSSVSISRLQSRAFSTSPHRASSPLFHLAALSASREGQFISKASGISRVDYTPNAQLLRAEAIGSTIPESRRKSPSSPPKEERIEVKTVTETWTPVSAGAKQPKQDDTPAHQQPPASPSKPQIPKSKEVPLENSHAQINLQVPESSDKDAAVGWAVIRAYDRQIQQLKGNLRSEQRAREKDQERFKRFSDDVVAPKGYLRGFSIGVVTGTVVATLLFHTAFEGDSKSKQVVLSGPAPPVSEVSPKTLKVDRNNSGVEQKSDDRAKVETLDWVKSWFWSSER
ncbi:MAG: hypothetical protein M1820_000987 [Bogoriella megaspora]|nr:MAG: hypothetical protein M1820_000987 [Bogoriella megaspora]